MIVGALPNVRRPAGRFSPLPFFIGIGVALVALAVSYTGSAHPERFLVIPVLGGGLLVLLAATRWPEATLPVCVFGLLVASTKFRLRDPMASLSGDVDAQVMLELALFACVGLATLVIARSRVFVPRPLSAAEGAFVAYALLSLASVLWSAEPSMTFIRGCQLAVIVLLALVIMRVFTPRHAVRALGVPLLIYTIGFATIAKLFPFAKGTQVDFLGIHRFSWFAVHPIDAATFAALAIVFVASELLFASAPLRMRFFRMPLWLALFPLAAILIVTHSRGPLLGCVAALGVVTVRRKVGVFAGLAAVAVLLMTGVALVNHGETTRTILNSAQASDNPVARLLLRGQTAEEFASFTDRDEVWSLAEDLILDRPIAGYGYQGSRSYLLAVVPWAAYAHNALLQTALDLGIIGTLLLWLPLVRGAFTGSLSDPYQDDDVLATRGATLAFVLFLLVSSFSSESFAAAPGFQTLLVFVCVLASERTRQQVREARRARPMVAFDRVVLVGAR